jgi:predicted DNA-binding ribbon-helix-helix protein
LHRNLEVQIADNAITLAGLIIENASEKAVLDLKATSREIECLFRSTEESLDWRYDLYPIQMARQRELAEFAAEHAGQGQEGAFLGWSAELKPVSATPTQIVASYIAAEVPADEIDRCIVAIKGKKVSAELQSAFDETIKEVGAERQSAFDKTIIEAIKRMCGDENFAAAALVQQVYDAEPGRDGWQRQMNSENKAAFVAGLHNLLGKLEDCRMTELKGRSAWLEHVNQLLDSVATTIATESTPSAGSFE